MAQRLAVGALRGHGVEGVADGDDPRSKRDLLAGQAVRVARAVPALVARADDRADRLQGGRGAEDALADDRVAAHELPLGVVQRPRLVQDRIGDGHLPDVVQLSGAGQLVEVLGCQVELAADRLGHLGHVVQVDVQLGLALAEGAQEHVARLAAGGGAATVLLRVHAPVRNLERLRCFVRLLGGQDGAERARDLEALASFGQGGARGGGQDVDPGGARPAEHAELVAAEPVRRAIGGGRLAKPAAQAGEQRVAGGVAVGVVVLLEAVEVEEHERHRVLDGRKRKLALEVLHQAAAVVQARQRVCQRLVLAGLEHALVGPEGERHSDDHERQREQAKDDGGLVERVEVLVGEQAERQQRAGGGHDDHPQAGQVGARRLGGGLPGGRADQQRGDWPEQVEQAALDVGPLGHLDQVDPVGHGHRHHSGGDQHPGAARAPGTDAEHADHEADQHQVAQRIGEVGGDWAVLPEVASTMGSRAAAAARAATASAPMAPSSHIAPVMPATRRRTRTIRPT